MHDISSWIFRLLHDREFRDQFILNGPTGALAEDLASLDIQDLLRASEKTLAQLGTRLRERFPEIFSTWAELSPDDPKGEILIARYAASDEYRDAANFGWSDEDQSFFTAFPRFLDEI